MPRVHTMTESNSVGTPDNTEVEKVTNMMRAVVMAIVSVPNEVSISALERSKDVVITIDVAVEDVGKILGKQGRTARSLRTIMTAATAPMQRAFSLNITDTRPDRTGETS